MLVSCYYKLTQHVLVKLHHYSNPSVASKVTIPVT